MRNGNTRPLLISLGSGIFLTVLLYAFSYLLSRYDGFSQVLGGLIAMLLAFPLFMFFHDREPPPHYFDSGCAVRCHRVICSSFHLFDGASKVGDTLPSAIIIG